MPEPTEFKDKTVLVTGASGGIGRGIALGFASQGAQVIVHYHKQKQKADQVKEEIIQQGGKAICIQADLTQPDQVNDCFKSIFEQSGRLDVLVNNAGVYLSSELITEMNPTDWQRMMDSDLNSVFLCTQAAAKMMAKQAEGGVILNIASVEGMFPVKGHSYYNVSKSGMIMLTRSSALELGSRNIRVNTISPGLIWKDGIDESWPDGVKAWIKNAPLHTLGKPEDIANACLFLASEKAKWITGSNLVVDGGFSCRALL